MRGRLPQQDGQVKTKRRSLTKRRLAHHKANEDRDRKSCPGVAATRERSGKQIDDARWR